MEKAGILIVDDKFITGHETAAILRELGYQIAGICTSSQGAEEKIEGNKPQLLIMDVHLAAQPRATQLLPRVRDQLNIPILFTACEANDETIACAAKVGAPSYLLKPLNQRQLKSSIEFALSCSRRRPVADPLTAAIGTSLASHELASTNGSGHNGNGSADSVASVARARAFAGVVGEHQSMQELRTNTELVALTEVTVHISGENGTGKELIADAVHQLSGRRLRPIVKINCSAIPAPLLESGLFGHCRGAFTGAVKDQEGFIESAHGGTLFLDEIGDLTLELQVKLLRLLQAREYSRVGETALRKADVRIITATNQSLEDLVKKNRMREDFFYRIHVFPLEIPALRDRGDDIFLLANHFRKAFNIEFSKKVERLSPTALELMQRYNWPGNVRQLENALKRAFVVVGGDTIEPAHLPPEIAKFDSVGGAVRSA